MKIEICDIQGCDEEATLIDDSDNVYCEDCMKKECGDYGTLPEDFESLKDVREAMRKQN